MKGLKLIIFDLDGTLVDAYQAIISSFNYTMSELKAKQQSNSVIRMAVGRGDENLLKPFINEKDLKKALIIYRRHHKKALLKDSRLFPGAKKLLRQLKEKGYKLAVASNRPTRFSWVLIRLLGLKKYLDYVLCADRLKQGKPHPEIMNKILRRFSLKPENALYIGDMTVDAQAGRRSKIKTVIVTTGSNTRLEIEKEVPFFIITKIMQLPKVIGLPL